MRIPAPVFPVTCVLLPSVRQWGNAGYLLLLKVIRKGWWNSICALQRVKHVMCIMEPDRKFPLKSLILTGWPERLRRAWGDFFFFFFNNTKVLWLVNEYRSSFSKKLLPSVALAMSASPLWITTNNHTQILKKLISFSKMTCRRMLKWTSGTKIERC